MKSSENRCYHTAGEQYIFDIGIWYKLKHASPVYTAVNFIQMYSCN